MSNSFFTKTKISLKGDGLLDLTDESVYAELKSEGEDFVSIKLNISEDKVIIKSNGKERVYLREVESESKTGRTTKKNVKSNKKKSSNEISSKKKDEKPQTVKKKRKKPVYAKIRPLVEYKECENYQKEDVLNIFADSLRKFPNVPEYCIVYWIDKCVEILNLKHDEVQVKHIIHVLDNNKSEMHNYNGKRKGPHRSRWNRDFFIGLR